MECFDSRQPIHRAWTHRESCLSFGGHLGISPLGETNTINNDTVTHQRSASTARFVLQADTSDTDATPPVEYENVTDTIKRRLESPVNTPETEKPEFKKSKIPLALKSPVPIKKEIKEGGIRSRGSSLERGKKKSESTMTDSTSSAMSVDSIKSCKSSAPPTPSTPNKDSSTFNLLQDSDLFTQISNNKLHAKATTPTSQQARPKTESCHVVEVKEHEIVKSTVTPVEPTEIYPFETIDAVVEFIPQNAETVNIIDDTATESSEHGSEEGKRPSVDLGSEPRTFVIEVKTLDARMKPTLGILKRRSDEGERPKSVRVAMEVPDLIPVEREQDVSMNTPPPTPLDQDEAMDCPLLYDLAVRQKEAQTSLRRDEVNEYLILDEVPKDQAALPEPSVTEEIADKLVHLKKQQIVDAMNRPIKKVGIGIGGSTPDRIRKKSASVVEEEVIYSEVEDMPQVMCEANSLVETRSMIKV